jgi:hypothetical protein
MKRSYRHRCGAFFVTLQAVGWSGLPSVARRAAILRKSHIVSAPSQGVDSRSPILSTICRTVRREPSFATHRTMIARSGYSGSMQTGAPVSM